MSNTPDQRTANMVHFPNKDETDPNALDEYLDNLVTGSGFVAITGTPVDNQVAVWTSATNIEGTTGLTYDGSSFGVTGNITVSGTVDGVDIAARDHDAVTLAGTGTYISLSGQQITVDPITESDISDLGNYVDYTGTPADNQIAVWTGDGTIEGTANFTWDDANTLSLTASGNLTIEGNTTGTFPTLVITQPHATLGDNYIKLQHATSGNNTFVVQLDGTEFLALQLDNTGRIGWKLRESSAALSDSAAFGQWWVKDDTPNIPKFTDDAGNDYSIVLDTKAQTITNKTAVESAIFEADNGYTVATLPTPTVGMIARVTDANSPSVGSTVSGSGAAAALVWYNGSNWTVIGV